MTRTCATSDRSTRLTSGNPLAACEPDGTFGADKPRIPHDYLKRPDVTVTPPTAARDAALLFDIEGELRDIRPFERGHIHDTYVSTWDQGGQPRRYLHQHLNQHVFRDVAALMHNVEQVTRHLAGKRQDHPAHGLQTLRLIATRGGGNSCLAVSGGYWRTYDFIENTLSFDQCDGTDRAYGAALAFGRFQADLSDLATDALRVTIPDFFSTPHRFSQLEDALARDEADRVSSAQREIRFVMNRRSMVETMAGLVRGRRIPERIVHGDTKLNNVLFDESSGRPVSVVDLDTCMPAWSLYDFGDLVRFSAATSSEDETDLTRAGMDIELYRALVAGFLDGTGSMLSEEEIRWMPFAARLVTYTIGLRFLADYLAGDAYFKVARPAHNLDRARVQFRMVESMERQAAEMIVRPSA